MRHVERAKWSDNYYLDLSGYGLFRHGMLRRAIDEMGADRILFGSDYPTCNPSMYIGGVLLDELISDEEKELIFSGNAKRLLGITDSFLGQPDTTAKSGIAKQVSAAQSAGRIASKKLMKQAHYADIFRIIFELNLAFADEPRQIHHEDADCMLAAEERFNRNDYYEYDAKTGSFYIDDCYNFSVDQNGAIEQQYPQLWELVKGDYAAGFYGPVEDINTQIIAWQHLEKLKYPFAKYIVEQKKQQREQMIAAQAKAMPPTANDVTQNAGNAAALPQAMPPAANVNGGM
jgi:hypothetical protein